jgi:ribonuclease/clavin/mitogillin
MMIIGHGPVILDGREKIRSIIRHREERERNILQCLSTNVPVDVIQIVNKIYANYPLAVHKAAANTVNQHLEKLLKEGKVRSINKGNSNWSWKRLWFSGVGRSYYLSKL